VQSVAVRLIVEREREIRAFVPDEYWDAFADLGRQTDAAPVRFQVSKYQGENFRPTNEASAMELLGLLKSQSFEIAKREDKPTRSRPNAPFITSTLQQSASTRMGFSVKKTTRNAKTLQQ
jgi:DNA topoisomerase-1